MINYNDLKKYDVIFFDIFDTLLFRSVEPEYVKKIWCNYIIKYFELDITMHELYQFRYNFELRLSNLNFDKGFDREFKYNDLICDIFNFLILNKYKISYDLFLEKCIEFELNIEKRVQKLDANIISIIKKLKKNNKKIYCISDMYLSKEMLTDIFSYHKITDLFDDVYVSCELSLNKKTGRLYKHVLEVLSIDPNKCVMIGDNFLSDFEVPNNLGIKAYHLNREEIYSFYSNYVNDNSQEKIYLKFKNILNSSTDNFEHIIFSLYTFIEKLYYNLLRDGKKDVIFLSREGEFLKKLFDIYVSKVYNDKICSNYLVVSRKSTYLPSLKSIESEDFSILFNQYCNMSVYDFLNSLNFTEDEINKIEESVFNDLKTAFDNFINENDDQCLKIEFTMDYKIDSFNKSSVFKKLIECKEFIDVYESRRITQCDNFKRYVKQITSSKDITVVDVGWNGSIQNNIQNILGNSYKINGYYLGLEKRNCIYDDTKKGLVFSNVPVFSDGYKLYNVNRAIYEILLGASHGSANMYKDKEGKIEVELFSKIEETNLYTQVISKIQHDMLETFERLCDLFINGFYDNIKYYKLFNKVHFNMMFKPSLKQLDFFNNIYHYENFGVFDFTTFNQNKKLNIKSRMRQNAKFLLKTSTYFNDTFWPMLKLYNYDMKFAKFLYCNMKKIQFKKSKII